MLRNYLLTAFRNFRNNKVYSLLNVFGLGIGLASCLLVFTIIDFEYSFDNWHTNKNQIYRVVRHYYGDNGVSRSASLPYPTGKAVMESIPDFEGVIPFHGPEDEKISLTDLNGNFQVFRQDQVLYTNSQFFETLDFKVLSGESADRLNEPGTAFLSEDMAIKYFGNQNPIGQVLRLNNAQDVTIAGIVENCPQNTSLPYQIIISMETLRSRMPNVFNNNWGMTWAYNLYVQVPPGANIADLEAKMDQVMSAHIDEEDKEKLKMKLQPLAEVHTDEAYGDGNNYVTPKLMIWAFIILGSLLLGTACLNFINLSTAQAIKRAKEVGIRKTLGGQKTQLIFQFLTETLIIVMAAMIIAFTLGQLLINQFNHFLSIISYDLEYSPIVILFGVGLALLVTFLAGFYPAMILARFKPVDALTNKINIKKGSGNFKLRRTLVIAQFAFTNLMLITTIIIARQMSYVKSQDLGFDQTNVALINFPDDVTDKMKTIAGAYRSQSFTADVAMSYTAPLSSSNWNNSYYERGGEYLDGNNANMKFGGEHYLDFYGIKIIAGRNVSINTTTDTTAEGVVNKKLLASLGWNDMNDALGKWLDIGSKQIKIVGIIENFHSQPLKEELGPIIFSYNPDQIKQLAVRLKNEADVESIAGLEAVFRQFYPQDLFEMKLLKEEINQHYVLENMLHKIIQFVAIITVLLSVMGLYGLVSFMANKNAKSIGIRKVFGASVGNILTFFIKEYVLLLLVAFVLSSPAAWWLTGLWLDEFTYRIEINALYFFLGFILSLLIATITVGYKSYMAAINNPIKSLRYE